LTTEGGEEGLEEGIEGEGGLRLVGGSVRDVEGRGGGKGVVFVMSDEVVGLASPVL
jgi:hypothetical protein